MAFAPRPRFHWQLRTRTLALGQRTRLMAILNLTPDSFSGDGLAKSNPETILEIALQHLDNGADILDLGAESTRPDATPLTTGEEQARLLPTLEAILRARPTAILSVDTYHAATARAAAAAGAEIINDVSGLLWDEHMAATLHETRCGFILMHTRGRSHEWRTQTRLTPAEVMPTILAGLRNQRATAIAAGIPQQNIVLDPGFGFGKQGPANFTLLAHFNQLQTLGHPLLAGLSRKSFLGKTIGPTQIPETPIPQPRLNATTAANTAAILQGAHILRIHDLQPAKEAAAIADQLQDTQLKDA